MSREQAARWSPHGRVALLAAAVWVVGHELALWLGAAAVVATPIPEHGIAWASVAAAILLAILGALVATMLRIAALRRTLRRLRGAPATGGRRRLGAVPRRWLAILAMALLAFTLQENLEHLLDHGHLPGLVAVLTGPYAATLPAFVLLSLLAAIVAVGLERRVRSLAAAVRLYRLHSRPPRIHRPAVAAELDALHATARRVAVRLGGRAPPVILSTISLR